MSEFKLYPDTTKEQALTMAVQLKADADNRIQQTVAMQIQGMLMQMFNIGYQAALRDNGIERPHDSTEG